MLFLNVIPISITFFLIQAVKTNSKKISAYPYARMMAKYLCLQCGQGPVYFELKEKKG